MNTAKMPIVSPKTIPVDVGQRLFCATLETIRNVQRMSPEIWARIEARSTELQAERVLQK